MKFLRDNNYVTITLNQLENYIKGNTELPGICKNKIFKRPGQS